MKASTPIKKIYLAARMKRIILGFPGIQLNYINPNFSGYSYDCETVLISSYSKRCPILLFSIDEMAWFIRDKNFFFRLTFGHEDIFKNTQMAKESVVALKK
jgi:hypothetical protein